MADNKSNGTRGAPDNQESSEKILSQSLLIAEESGTDNKTKRMTIQLTFEAAKKLELLAANQGISQVEALRRAISTEAYFQEEIQQGSKVLLQTKDSLQVVIFR